MWFRRGPARGFRVSASLTGLGQLNDAHVPTSRRLNLLSIARWFYEESFPLP